MNGRRMELEAVFRLSFRCTSKIRKKVAETLALLDTFQKGVSAMK